MSNFTRFLVKDKINIWLPLQSNHSAPISWVSRLTSSSSTKSTQTTERLWMLNIQKSRKMNLTIWRTMNLWLHKNLNKVSFYSAAIPAASERKSVNMVKILLVFSESTNSKRWNSSSFANQNWAQDSTTWWSTSAANSTKPLEFHTTLLISSLVLLTMLPHANSTLKPGSPLHNATENLFHAQTA